MCQFFPLLFKYRLVPGQETSKISEMENEKNEGSRSSLRSPWMTVIAGNFSVRPGKQQSCARFMAMYFPPTWSRMLSLGLR